RSVAAAEKRRNVPATTSTQRKEEQTRVNAEATFLRQVISVSSRAHLWLRRFLGGCNKNILAPPVPVTGGYQHDFAKRPPHSHHGAFLIRPTTVRNNGAKYFTTSA
ncbi:MAG: hypothetical protein QF792_05105, partial [Phycisphaerae bacterium]|nr:hypothetical protein [Phycisphaerae bacterium]